MGLGEVGERLRHFRNLFLHNMGFNVVVKGVDWLKMV